MPNTQLLLCLSVSVCECRHCIVTSRCAPTGNEIARVVVVVGIQLDQLSVHGPDESFCGLTLEYTATPYVISATIITMIHIQSLL